jgi:anti-sigma B factor antagonist
MNTANLPLTSNLEVVTQEAPNGVTVVLVNGVVDAYSLEQFSRVFNDLVDQKAHRLIVDLSGLEYVNMHGTGILVGMHEIAKQNSGTMVLVNPNHTVQDAFNLLGFPDLFRIASDTNQALEIFKQYSL